MQNPWVHLPETAPFLLEIDRSLIQNFNSRAKSHHQIHHELFPEPYTGNPRANIILLNLNPGFYDRNARFLNGDVFFQKTSRANLAHTIQDYPFYLLDPRNINSPGYYWYKRKFGRLIERFGTKRVAEEICVIEYFPYTTQHFGCNFQVPSQKYSFYLVEEAMKRNALIIQMRSKGIWQKAIPALINYPRYFILKNPQNPTISDNNCPDGYPEIVEVFARRAIPSF
jgi:hypothetical protein